jgi:hypothetical protein
LAFSGIILHFGILAGGVTVKITLVVLLILLSSGLVCAQESQEYPSTSGNAYLRECSVIEKDSKDFTQTDMKYVFACIAYTEGVLDGVQAEDGFQKLATGKTQTAPFCIPDAADNGQIIRITLKYIRNNPEEAHKTTAVLIVEAVREAFPCVAHTAKKK